MERFTTRAGGVDLRIVVLLNVAMGDVRYGSNRLITIDYKTKV
jgi:hypothetical protein